MPTTMTDRLAGVHPKMLKASGEDGRKKLAEQWKSVVGNRIDRALEIAGITKQQAATDMGYTDQTTVSRWIAGVERPHFDKLFALDGFVDAFLIALAERGGKSVTVTTQISVARYVA